MNTSTNLAKALEHASTHPYTRITVKKCENCDAELIVDSPTHDTIRITFCLGDTCEWIELPIGNTH